MANSIKQGIYEFDGFRLDAAKLMLYRDGEEISLPPKVIETLVVLVENQGEIVSKEEIMNRVWADAAVEESNLSQYLYLLRKTLGARATGAPFIETFRRRGYRFNANVRLTESYQTNGSDAPVLKNSDAARFDVERSGNVLRLTDWNRNTEHPPENLSKIVAASDFQFKQLSPGKIALVAAVAVFVALLVSLSFIRFGTAGGGEQILEKPDEMTFLRLTNGNVPNAATISPNGDYFIYDETDGERSHLWLQQTGQANRLEIISPWNGNIFGKTFSPDGKFVYFVAQNKGETITSLYRVPTLGGAAQKILTDINSPVSFSPNGGEMVFQRWNAETGETSLVTTASDGGEEKVLLTSAAGSEFLTNPAWSPDNQRIAFCAIYPQTESPLGYATISAVNRQTGEISALSNEKWGNCFRMIWLRDGRGLIFIGTRLRDALSTRREQIYYLSTATGEARPLTFDGNRHHIFSLGVTNDDAVLVSPFNRASQIWRVAANGDPRSAAQLTNGLADGRGGIAPLADGRVAYITRVGEFLNVWLMDSDGANQRQLTDESAQIEELRAAPDGSFFVFATVRNGVNQLIRINADGANPRQLTFGDKGAVDSTVSPDGNWVVYNIDFFIGVKSAQELWKIPSTGGEPINLNVKDCRTPHFSFNGKYLSCIRNEKEIVVVSSEDGAVIKTFKSVEGSLLNTGARWTADGLIYIVLRKNVSNLWLQPLDGADARPLSNFKNGSIYNFAVAADGASIYLARGSEVTDVVLIKNFR